MPKLLAVSPRDPVSDSPGLGLPAHTTTPDLCMITEDQAHPHSCAAACHQLRCLPLLVTMLRKYIHVYIRVTCFGLFGYCMTGPDLLTWPRLVLLLQFSRLRLSAAGFTCSTRSCMPNLLYVIFFVFLERTLPEVTILVDHTLYVMKQL